MDRNRFEALLTEATAILTQLIRSPNSTCREPRAFEAEVRKSLRQVLRPEGLEVPEPRPQLFPDICIEEFGVEVKTADSWRTIANSVFESTREEKVKHIYILLAKLGGTPEVRWGRYEECVVHVRTSHVPRFEVEIGTRESLFAKLGITYDRFRVLPEPEKMKYIREYAKGRDQDRYLWWVDARPEGQQQHSVPLEVEFFTRLDDSRKRRLRAEATLLFPEVLKGARVKGKYDRAAAFFISYHGVLSTCLRDQFTAGSVGAIDAPRRPDRKAAGKRLHIREATIDIQEEILRAAQDLEDAIFQEHWGRSVAREERVKEWLKIADNYAVDWTPSTVLFRGH